MHMLPRGEEREDQWAAEVHWGAPAYPGGWEGGAGSVPEVGQDEESLGVHHLQPGAEWNPCQTGWGNKVKGLKKKMYSIYRGKSWMCEKPW